MIRNRAQVYTDFFRVFHETASPRCRDYGGGTPNPHGHAASMEALLSFIEAIQVRCLQSCEFLDRLPEVWDAGSGASTAVLCNEGWNVTTFDPDHEYMDEVITTVKKMGLKPPMIGQILPASQSGPCDACFYDYGTHHRLDFMPRFMRLTRSVFYIDDCHAPTIEVVAERLGQPYTWSLSMKDEHHRYGMLIVNDSEDDLMGGRDNRI